MCQFFVPQEAHAAEFAIEMILFSRKLQRLAQLKAKKHAT